MTEFDRQLAPVTNGRAIALDTVRFVSAEALGRIVEDAVAADWRVAALFAAKLDEGRHPQLFCVLVDDEHSELNVARAWMPDHWWHIKWSPKRTGLGCANRMVPAGFGT